MSRLSFLVSFTALLLATSLAEAQTAKEILEKVDQVGHTDTARMKLSQKVITPGGESRQFKMLSYSENGAEKGLTVYVDPPQVAGMKILTLNDGDDIWSYFPRTNRTRKIASSARNRKVQGSDFSYDDMAGGKMAEKWHGKVLGEEKLGGKACFKLELEPTASGPRSYSRIIAWIVKADYTTVRIKYYDLDGDEFKQLDISKYKRFVTDKKRKKSVMIPYMYVMKNLTDGGETLMKVAAAEVNVKLEEGLFSEAGLSR
jgi:outer membrane lipoprotein-sorting protein